MPTGTCKFPEHHSPSAGPPAGLLGSIALGAIIIAFWHDVVVALVVVTILACIAGLVFLLIHNHHSGYDAQLERQAAVAEVERKAAAGQLVAAQQHAVEAAPVHNHQHLHLYGVAPAEVAELLAQQRELAAIEEGRQSW